MSAPPPSIKDANQVLQYAFDDAEGKLRVDATISPSGTDLEIDHSDDSIAIGTASDLFTSTTIGPAVGLDVNVINPITAVIDTGDSILVAGTEDGTISGTTHVLKVTSDLNLNVKDEAADLSLSSIDSKLTTTVDGLKVDGSAVIQPVSQASTWDINDISGTVSLPTGAATEAKQDTGNTSLASIDSKVPSNLTVTSTRLLVDGSGVTQPVSGTVSATQSGTWDINNISGTVSLPTGAATDSSLTTINTTLGSPMQQTGGAVSVTNFPATQPISAVSLPLPTGASTEAKQDTANTSLASIDLKLTSPITVTGPLTDAELRATPVPVSGTIITSPDVNVHDGSGISITSTGGALDVNVTNSTLAVTQSGTWNINDVSGTISLPTGAATSANQSTEITALGTINTTLGSPFQAGGSIGNTTFASTQSGTWNVGLNSGSNTVGKVDQGVGGASAWKVDGSAVTQPVSGPLTDTQLRASAVPISAASLPLPTGAATSALQTQPGVDIGDVTINNASGGSAVNIQDGGNSITVDGAVTANAGTNLNTSLLALDTSVNGVLLAQDSTTSGQTGPLVQGAVTTAAPTYTTGKTSPLSLTTAGALRVDTSGSTISGTITANQGTSPWVENVSQFGGSNVVTGTGASGAGIPRVTVSNDSNILATQSGTWNITNVSGTVSLPTGASTGTKQDTGNTSLASIDGKIPSNLTVSSTRLLTDGSGVTQPVSGTITANIGTSGSLALDATVATVQGSVTGGVAGTKSSLTGAIYNSSAPTLTNGQQSSLQLDVNGNLKTVTSVSFPASIAVAGDVASGSADSGNPVKVGAVYNSSLPTPSSGQRINLQTNNLGELAVVNRNKFSNIVGAGTTTIKSGAGRVHIISLNTQVNGSITVYDNTAGSGTKIGTISQFAGNNPISLTYDVEFATGLTLVTTGGGTNLTISYE